MKDKILNFLMFTSFIILLSAIYLMFNQNESEKFESKIKGNINSFETKEQKKHQNTARKDISKNIISVKINEPEAFGGKTKDEIYRIRTSYVKQSPFWHNEYKPADYVFGEIEDGLPWYSNISCSYRDTNLAKIDGVSEEARFINNPTALIMVELPYARYWCDKVPQNYQGELMPKSISYNKKENTITVRYNLLKRENPPRCYSFNGINARDFGYHYMYIDLEKSTFAPEFVDENTNVGNSVIELQNFIHKGGSCGHESGCNNGSPKQVETDFYVTKAMKKEQNPVYKLHVKLWKERPNSPKDPADITEILIFKGNKK